MSSSVDICNEALLLLGSRKINSFEEETVEARLCDVQYPLSKEFILRKHPWNFAIKRAILARLSEDVFFGWEYQFEKPADFIRLLEIVTLSSQDPGSKMTTCDEYLFEGNRILSNSPYVGLRYVSTIDDASMFDSEFKNVLAYHLAIELCESLNGSTSMKNELLRTFEGLLSDAQGTDGRENPIIQVEQSDWLLARRY